MEAKEKLLWSIALPGFGQLLNGDYVKGIVFIVLEILVNVQANLNTVILLSFTGEIEQAIQQADYQWLMFYPCLYFFSMWDAFKDGGGGKEPYSFMPFLSLAYIWTIGVIYSAKVTLFGVHFGPIWFPFACTIPALWIGFALKRILARKTSS